MLFMQSSSISSVNPLTYDLRSRILGRKRNIYVWPDHRTRAMPVIFRFGPTIVRGLCPSLQVKGLKDFIINIDYYFTTNYNYSLQKYTINIIINFSICYSSVCIFDFIAFILTFLMNLSSHLFFFPSIYLFLHFNESKRLI